MHNDDFIQQFHTDLSHLGLQPGMLVLVHSSLRAFGQVPGGPDTIITALLDYLGKEGTLLMPALSYMSVTPQQPSFDLKHTPACVGIIPETFRRRPDVLRSMHPTHSVCAMGKLAQEITAEHEQDATPCGVHSPFHFLLQYDGYILMLGCGLKPNTSMHAVEELAQPPYLFDEPIWYTLTDGEGHTCQKLYTPHGFHGWQQRYDRISSLMTTPDLSSADVAGARCHLIRAKALWSVALAHYQKDPYFFVEAGEGH